MNLLKVAQALSIRKHCLFMAFLWFSSCPITFTSIVDNNSFQWLSRLAPLNPQKSHNGQNFNLLCIQLVIFLCVSMPFVTQLSLFAFSVEVTTWRWRSLACCKDYLVNSILERFMKWVINNKAFFRVRQTSYVSLVKGSWWPLKWACGPPPPWSLCVCLH